MKKLLFIMVIGFGGAMLVKSGQVTASSDNQIRVAGYTVPLPAAVQQSPLMAMVAGMLPTPATAAAAPGTPRQPMMPVVTSASGSFDANTTGRANTNTGGPATGAAGFNAAAKALRGSQ